MDLKEFLKRIRRSSVKAQLIQFSSIFEGSSLKESLILEGMDFHRVDLSHLNLEGINGSGADFSFANLESSKLKKSNLSFANLYSANLNGADLYEADLRGTKLFRIESSNTIFKRALFDELTILPFSFQVALERGMIFDDRKKVLSTDLGTILSGVHVKALAT